MELKKILSKKGLSLMKISKECGIPYSTLYLGVEKPESFRAGNLKKMADYLRMSMDDLYNLLQKTEEKRLLNYLKEQKDMKLKGSIYHYTQINFTAQSFQPSFFNIMFQFY